MIEVTDIAASELNKMLEKENKTDHRLRVFVAGVGCSGVQYGLTLATSPESGDGELENNGVKIFYSDDVKDDINELKIDFIDNEHGNGFVIENPNASCGSGCSSCG